MKGLKKIPNAIKGKAFDFLWSIAAKKGVKAAVQFVVAAAAAGALKKYGLDFNADPAILTAAMMALLEAARNWLKHKLKLPV